MVSFIFLLEKLFGKAIQQLETYQACGLVQTHSLSAKENIKSRSADGGGFFPERAFLPHMVRNCCCCYLLARGTGTSKRLPFSIL